MFNLVNASILINKHALLFRIINKLNLAKAIFFLKNKKQI